VPRPVKTRAYDSSRRRAQAEDRKRDVLAAAGALFEEQGYAATAMTDVARRAGVALDTVYALVGRKPDLLLAVHDLLLGEGAVDEHGDPVPAVQRAYVRRMRATEGAAAKLAVYAESLAQVLPRTAPLMEALREAGATDARCREVWQHVEDRRAANMRHLVADLRSTGELRADVTDDVAADLVWSMNAASYFLALRRRGYSPADYAALVRDVWTRTLVS
jgi:AcrR family transcriptional regulator